MSVMAILQQFGATLVFCVLPFNNMTAATRSFWKIVLHGLAWILFIFAGLAFWAGGRAISEFGKIDRILSEMLGLGIASVAGALGYILKTTADDLGSEQDSPDQ
jgi:hypothetical protein